MIQPEQLPVSANVPFYQASLNVTFKLCKNCSSIILPTDPQEQLIFFSLHSAAGLQFLLS